MQYNGAIGRQLQYPMIAVPIRYKEVARGKHRNCARLAEVGEIVTRDESGQKQHPNIC